MKFPTRKLVVVWRVTERCNLGCAFCAYDRELPFYRSQADASEVERFGKLLCDWSASKDQEVLISWLGGEPLLWAPLMPLSKKMRALGVQLSITTNGTLLSNLRLSEQLLEHFAELTVSIDAWGNLHDELRDWRGGFGKLQASLIALFEARERMGSKLRIRVNVVLMRATVAAFPELCSQLSQWPIQAISFNGLGGADRPEFYATQHLLPEQIEALAAVVPELRQRLHSRGITLSGDENYLRRLRHTAARWPIAVRDCQPGQRFLFVNERGRMAPCHFTAADYGVEIAGLHTPRDLDAALEHFANAQTANSAAACADCMSTQVFGKFAA